MDRAKRITELRKAKPKNWFLIISGLIVAGMVIWAWVSSQPLLGRLSAERRWKNFKTFLNDLVPKPVRKSDGDWSEAVPWAIELFKKEDVSEAIIATLGIATAAIIIAAAMVLPFLVLSSRRLSRINPLGLPSGQSSALSRWFWKLIGPLVRLGYVISRAIPEYLLAFLLISLLGRQVWPLVLALAIHNFGIMGRLWGEVVENASTKSAEQRIASGDTRLNVFGTSLFPQVFNRFLIYFFYRWETCIKDATVLGMLGLLTLGNLIIHSKGFFWDQMFFYVLIGSALIMAGDLISTLVRSKLR